MTAADFLQLIILNLTGMIKPDIEIEDLVRDYPFSVRYLMEHGIKCIACGEPVWGTLAEAAKEKGYGNDDILRFVNEMNEIAEKESDTTQDSKLPKIDTGKLGL